MVRKKQQLLFCLPRWVFPVILIVAWLQPSQAQVLTDALAATGRLGAANQLPSLAGTLFTQGRWNAAGMDRVSIAEHELTHAIGFDESYTLFRQHLFAGPDAFTRNFRQGNAASQVLGVLLPAPTTHLDIGDPKLGGGFTGRTVMVGNQTFEQDNDLMRSVYRTGLRVGEQDKLILNAAFAWSTVNNGGLKITVDYLTPDLFTAAEKADIMRAAGDVEALFAPAGGGAGNNAFTWRVATQAAVPEPGTLALLCGGLLPLLGMARHRRG